MIRQHQAKGRNRPVSRWPARYCCVAPPDSHFAIKTEVWEESMLGFGNTQFADHRIVKSRLIPKILTT